MRKADLQAGVEYAWREQQHEWGKDGPRRVRLLKILDGKRVLVADADGEFEATTTKLECPWLARQIARSLVARAAIASPSV